jgi:hypothetical protein
MRAGLVLILWLRRQEKMAINEKTPSGMAVPKGEFFEGISKSTFKNSYKDCNTIKPTEAITNTKNFWRCNNGL